MYNVVEIKNENKRKGRNEMIEMIKNAKTVDAVHTHTHNGI